MSTVHQTRLLHLDPYYSLEAQLPIYWVPVFKSLYKFVLSTTQGPTVWVPGLLGILGTALKNKESKQWVPYAMLCSHINVSSFEPQEQVAWQYSSTKEPRRVSKAYILRFARLFSASSLALSAQPLPYRVTSKPQQNLCWSVLFHLSRLASKTH